MHLLKWKELYRLKILLYILGTVTSNKYKWSDTLMRKECDHLFELGRTSFWSLITEGSNHSHSSPPYLPDVDDKVFISFILKISKFKFRNFPEGNNYASLHIQAQKWTSPLFLQDLLLAWGRSKYVIRLTHMKLSH